MVINTSIILGGGNFSNQASGSITAEPRTSFSVNGLGFRPSIIVMHTYQQYSGNYPNCYYIIDPEDQSFYQWGRSTARENTRGGAGNRKICFDGGFVWEGIGGSNLGCDWIALG